MKNQKPKNCKTKNRRGRPSYFAVGSIWRMEQSNRQSASLKTMLAQVNTLNSLPFLNMNALLYFYFHVRFIVLLKGWKLPQSIGLESPSLILQLWNTLDEILT